MSLSLALRLYRWAFIAYIVFASAKTLLAANELAAGAVAGGHHHLSQLITPDTLKVLAGVEIAAALAFLARTLEVYAGAVLLAVFAFAAVLDFSTGGAPIHLFLYAATVGFFLAARGEARH